MENLSSSAPKRRRLRIYVPLNRRRRRGGQLGNLNAVKHGRYAAEARARRARYRTLISEIEWALEVVKPLCRHPGAANALEKGGEGGTKKSKTIARNSPMESTNAIAKAPTEAE